MEDSLYPKCDFTIWFRSVNEHNITEIPIEGIKTGKKSDISSTLQLLIFLLKELYPTGSMVHYIKMDQVYLM